LTIKAEIRDKVIKIAQESKLGRNALAKTLQIEGIKVSSGSISKILKEWKESRSKSNNDSIIDTTAATSEQTKSVDEITQSATSDGQSQPLLEFRRGFPSYVSKSIDMNTSGSPILNGTGLAPYSQTR
jgi:subtilisin family serine protease